MIQIGSNFKKISNKNNIYIFRTKCRTVQHGIFTMNAFIYMIMEQSFLSLMGWEQSKSLWKRIGTIKPLNESISIVLISTAALLSLP